MTAVYLSLSLNAVLFLLRSSTPSVVFQNLSREFKWNAQGDGFSRVCHFSAQVCFIAD